MSDVIHLRTLIVGERPWVLVEMTGISPSTFSRIGLDGGGVNTRSLVRLLVWLGDTDLKPYIRMEADDAH